jgi:hypothetical protein
MKNIHIEDEIHQVVVSLSKPLNVNSNKLGECIFNIGMIVFMERILSTFNDSGKVCLSADDTDLLSRSGAANLLKLQYVCDGSCNESIQE